MSSAQLNAGENHGRAEAKTEQWVQSSKETAQSAREKASDATQSAQEKASDATNQSSGFLQQTGEQVKSMAQGAIDGVKNTLGVGEQSKK